MPPWPNPHRPKPPQLNEESAEGAAASVGYFLNLYRYAFMTGNTTEFAAMSDDRCKFCKSTIDDANDIHSKRMGRQVGSGNCQHDLLR